MGIKFVIAPWLNTLVDVLWKNKSQIIKVLDDPTLHRMEIDSVSTELLGLPEELLEQLPHSDMLEMLNEFVPHMLDSNKTKKAFARELVESITDDVVTVK